MKLIKIFFFSSFFSIFLIIIPLLNYSRVFAEIVLLEDNFDDGNADGWDKQYNGWGKWEVKEIANSNLVNFIYEGEITLQGYPEKPSYRVNGHDEWTDYIFEVDIKGIQGVDKVVGFRFRSPEERYLLNIVSQWSNGGNIINIHKQSPKHTEHIYRKSFINFPDRWYRLKIIVTNINETTTNIKVYIKDLDYNIDHGLVINYNDSNYPIKSGKICLHMWPGGPEGLGSITKTQFDNIRVATELPLSPTPTFYPTSTPTPSPTSTPTPVSPAPIILIPGTYACWSSALLKGTDAENWTLFPLAYTSVYKNLIDSLNNAGFQQNKDWYLFCYDWRKPLKYNSEKLKDFIDNNIGPPGVVNLIGHSMGGLISRVFTQIYPEKVNKAIILGSPHQGVVRVYPAWEGGQLWEYEGIFKIILKIFLEVNKKYNEHPVNTIRRIVPSLKDLLPTFNFLLDIQSGNYKNIITHIHQNETMNELNKFLTTEAKTKMNIIFGEGYDTLDAIRINSITNQSQNWLHRALGLWEDGEPVYSCSNSLCEYTDYGKDYSSSMIYSQEGDKTVLVKSAIIDGIQSFEMPIDHNGLVKDQVALQQIFNLLGMNIPLSISSSDLPKEALAFLLMSPAKITIKDPEEKQAGWNFVAPKIENSFYDDETNFLLIPDPIQGIYQIKINGMDTGNYTLFIAKLNADNIIEIVEYQLPTESGKINIYSLDSNNQIPFLDDPEGNLIFESGKTKINKIRDKLKPICKNKILPVLLEKINNSMNAEQYRNSKELIKTLVSSLNYCLFNLDENQVLELLPDYRSIINDLSNFYQVCSLKQGSELHRREVYYFLPIQEKLLFWQSKKFQNMTDKGKEISMFKALLFENTSDLLNEIKKSLEREEFAKARLLGYQVNFFLLHLMSN